MDENKIETQTRSIISYLNYKDILIILSVWYIVAVFNTMTGKLNFNNTILTDIFHFLFILTGRFIFLGLIIFYLSSLYTISFKDLGINFHNFKQQLFLGISLILALLISVILILNIPLTYTKASSFSPLYQINSPEIFIQSLLPLSLFLLANLINGLTITFLLSNFIYKLFYYIIHNRIISLILSCLFYSVLLLDFNPGRILINFILALIILYLYLKADSLITASIFVAGYYSIYIFYIYGWNFMKF